jgi:hypothetical protein
MHALEAGKLRGFWCSLHACTLRFPSCFQLSGNLVFLSGKLPRANHVVRIPWCEYE